VAMMVHPTPAVNHQPQFAAACATSSADHAVSDGVPRERLIGARRQRRALGAGGVA
jgi:hypothetical protein